MLFYLKSQECIKQIPVRGFLLTIERERERKRENERKENCYFTFYYQHFHSALFILSQGLYAHNRLTRIDVKQENANKDWQKQVYSDQRGIVSKIVILVLCHFAFSFVHSSIRPFLLIILLLFSVFKSTTFHSSSLINIDV